MCHVIVLFLTEVWPAFYWAKSRCQKGCVSWWRIHFLPSSNFLRPLALCFITSFFTFEASCHSILRLHFFCITISLSDDTRESVSLLRTHAIVSDTQIVRDNLPILRLITLITSGVFLLLFIDKSCLTLYNPMDCCMPGFPVLHYLPEFAQIHVHWISDAM